MATTITKSQLKEMIKEALSEQQSLNPKTKNNGKDPQIQKALQIESKVLADVASQLEKAKAQIEQLLVGKTVTIMPPMTRDPFKGTIKAVEVFADEDGMVFEVVIGKSRWSLSAIIG